MGNKAVFQRRHYELIAKEVAELDATGPMRRKIAVRFSTLFTIDNPLFQRDRFLKACGVKVVV